MYEYEWSVFFFQAEDGIRDVAVTGVQTCALPIYRRPAASDRPVASPSTDRVNATALDPEDLPLERGSHSSPAESVRDRKSTRLNSSHGYISYAVFCLKKKTPNYGISATFSSRHTS